MDSSDETWRYQYYILDLKDIMDISRELVKDRPVPLASGYGIGPRALTLGRPSDLSLSSPTSRSLRSTGIHTVGSSPTSLRTGISMSTSQDGEFSTRMTSPTSVSQASISPTSPASNVSTTHVELHCPKCGDKFCGKPANANKNLKRHLETSSKHNENPGVDCPQPDCSARPSRADNLRSHLIRKHGLFSQEVEQAIKKSKRMSDVPEDHEILDYGDIPMFFSPTSSFS